MDEENDLKQNEEIIVLSDEAGAANGVESIKEPEVISPEKISVEQLIIGETETTQTVKEYKIKLNPLKE